MGQITIYLDDNSERRLKRAAQSEGVPVSRWIAGLVEREIRAEWPHSVRELAGAWDRDFPDGEQIRAGDPEDSPREPL